MNTYNTNFNLITNCFKSIDYLNSRNNFKLAKTKTALNILYLNAISIRNKLHSDILDLINSYTCKVHIIVITETRLFREENKFYDIDGYSAYHSNRRLNEVKGRGGGAAIYVCNSIISSLIF